MKKYLSLVKFVHTVFALPFALVGFTLGMQEVQVENWGGLLLKVLVCMVAARNAAMGYNRYLDREIDAGNPRTAGREIPAGILSPVRVKWFVLINCLVFIAGAFWINLLCGLLSPVALLVLLGYSYMKRISAICHFVLGLALGIAPLGAYLAVTGKFAFAPAILSVIVMLWSGAFDILYALADEEFDRAHKLHSIPALIGRKNAMILSGIVHAAILPLLYLFYLAAFPVVGEDVWPFSPWYAIGAVFFAAMLIYQHAIVTPSNLSRLNAAFFTANGIASVVFAIFTIVALLLS